MLTITITDPSGLPPHERTALAAFFADLAGLIKPAAVIAPADRPDVGEPVAHRTVQLWQAPTPPAPDADGLRATLDPATIFGGAPASSVPVPPAIPTPPAPPAADASPPASVPVPTAGAPQGGATLDSKGLPWDARIHASTKGQNADGGWKKRKNTPDEVIAAVEGELRALMSIAPSVGTETSEPSEAPMTFASLMGWVTQQVAANKLTQTEVAGVVRPIGLASVVGLNMRPDLIPQVRSELEAIVASKAST